MTTIQWAIAKYVPDTERNEPVNVGVILWGHDGPIQRFVGQREDGQIDGRQTKYVRSLDTYRAWIHHWTKSASDASSLASLVSKQPASRGRANYFLESGGEILLGAGQLDDEELLDDLYSRLVISEPPLAAPPIGRLAESLIQRVQPRLHGIVERGAVVPVVKGGIEDVLQFDFRYNNGRPHLMQNVSLARADNRSWEQVHAASWTFTQVHDADHEDLKNADLVALVKGRAENENLERQIQKLEQHAQVVRLDDVPRAEQELFEILEG